MQQDIMQRDLVHYAAANHNSEAIEFLISKRVDINNSKINWKKKKKKKKTKK